MWDGTGEDVHRAFQCQPVGHKAANHRIDTHTRTRTRTRRTQKYNTDDAAQQREDLRSARALLSAPNNEVKWRKGRQATTPCRQRRLATTKMNTPKDRSRTRTRARGATHTRTRHSSGNAHSHTRNPSRGQQTDEDGRSHGESGPGPCSHLDLRPSISLVCSITDTTHFLDAKAAAPDRSVLHTHRAPLQAPAAAGSCRETCQPLTGVGLAQNRGVFTRRHHATITGQSCACYAITHPHPHRNRKTKNKSTRKAAEEKPLGAAGQPSTSFVLWKSR